MMARTSSWTASCTPRLKFEAPAAKAIAAKTRIKTKAAKPRLKERSRHAYESDEVDLAQEWRSEPKQHGQATQQRHQCEQDDGQGEESQGSISTPGPADRDSRAQDDECHGVDVLHDGDYPLHR